MRGKSIFPTFQLRKISKVKASASISLFSDSITSRAPMSLRRSNSRLSKIPFRQFVISQWLQCIFTQMHRL